MTILTTITRMLRQWKRCLGTFMNQCFLFLPNLNCQENIGIVSFICMNFRNGTLDRFSSGYCSVLAYHYRTCWYKPIFFPSVVEVLIVKMTWKCLNGLKFEIHRIWIFLLFWVVNVSLIDCPEVISNNILIKKKKNQELWIF